MIELCAGKGITSIIERVSNHEVKLREVIAAPYAAALVEGHRDFGYNLQTALADVIDNAITAGAGKVELIADTVSDEPWIAVADNGCGMSEAELVEAMRLGSKNPTDHREAHDLGRFGLGLKSASFSQCRSLTVLTRRDGVTSCARWDLDRIAERNDWALELLDDIEAIPTNDLLPDTGTVVVWQKLDRLSGGYTNDQAKRARHINAELAGAERHLRLVFHRFLERRKPRLNLLLNGRSLDPIDPMASDHPATQKDPEDPLQLKGGLVKVRCHTLPHHKRMERDEWDELGGPDGHLKSQGLYVYREDRLIIAGGWLGLARQAELTKLCRIAVDIPNTMDSEWKIDVKKASAQLPPVVRERLRKVVERFVGTSKRTYRAKGRKLVDETRHPIWNRVKTDGQITFRPNLGHPVFQAFEGQLPGELVEGFERCMRLVGSGLPVEALHADLVGNAEAVTPEMMDMADLEAMVRALATTLLDNGVDAAALQDTLDSYPLLRAYREAVEEFLKRFLEERAD